MNLPGTILFLLASAFVFVHIGRFFKLPDVVSLIACGLFANVAVLRNFFVEPNTQAVFNLGDFAVILLMFFTGLESSWSFLRKEEGVCLFIGLFAASTTFILGFGVALLLGFPLLAALLAGTALSITDEGTTAKYLMDIKKLKTRVGSAMVGSGIVDDFLGLGLFVAITYSLKESYLRDDLFIMIALAAFFAGLLVQKMIGHRWFGLFEKVIMHGIIPFFFVSIAFHFKFSSLVVNLVALFSLLFAALAGKIVGTLLTKKHNSFTLDRLYLIGWGMNSRGALGMVIALIAFRNNLIPVDLYSTLVLITVLTTLMFPFAASRIIASKPNILN
ncbi:MAG: cation:proton antiporter [Candidatus Woesearchaeota archaeon]